LVDDSDVENAPNLSFKLCLNNSIICLDDLRDAIVVKLDLYFIYDRFNIKFLKHELLKQRLSKENELENSALCKDIRFNIVKCNPFFCKFDDLDGTKKLEKINRREIIKPFAICYSSKSRIERYLVDEFRTNYNTDITVDQVAVKISINQIVSFLSMIKNTSNILHEKYTEKIKKD